MLSRWHGSSMRASQLCNSIQVGSSISRVQCRLTFRRLAGNCQEAQLFRSAAMAGDDQASQFFEHVASLSEDGASGILTHAEQ